MKAMKRLGIILFLCMLLSVIPMTAIPVSAAGETPLPSTGGELASGDYILNSDITLTSNITIATGATVGIDLNNCVLNLNGYRIVNAGTLNLKDTGNSTVRYFYDADGDGCYESYAATASAGSIAVTGGVITGGDTKAASETLAGGAVYNTGTFNMYSGAIVGNKLASGNDNSAEGGGVCNRGTFVMTDGLIAGNLVYGQSETEADNIGGGVFNDEGATFTMNGGTISHNKATGDGVNYVENCYGFGGGIVTYGTFAMNGGSVTDNICDQNGGGIYVSMGGSLTVTAGTVADNKAKFGAGICISGTSSASVQGGTFTDNAADFYGGAIFNLGTLSVTGGTFTDNSAYLGGAIYADSGFTLGGSVNLASNGKAGNVYLKNGALITVDNYTGHCAVSKAGTTGVISTATESKYASNFTSENTSYGIRFNSANQLEISAFTVTVATGANGTVSAGGTAFAAGKTVILAATPDNGFKLGSYTVTRNDTGASVSVTGNTFTMPASDVTVSFGFVANPSYTITYIAPANGTVTVAASAGEGDTVTLSNNPAAGYLLSHYFVYKTGDSASAVSVTNGSFIMPSYPVTVTALFINDTTDYLTFTSDAAFTVTPNASNGLTKLQYSTDKVNWTNITSATAISSSGTVPYVLYFRGTAKGTDALKMGEGYQWKLTPAEGHTIAASGDIMTLIDWQSPATATMGEIAFSYMFRGATCLTSAPKLTATKVAAYGYSYMFYNCTKLANAPDLPATKVGNFGYSNMFYNCNKLTNAPDLPATDLANGAYAYMFEYCTSLTRIPKLAATNLPTRCYQAMFAFCSGIKLYTKGSGEYFMIPSGAKTTFYTLSGMFGNTGGGFTGTPSLGTKYYYSTEPDTTEYLTFTAEAAFTVTPNGKFTNLEYSTDKGDWNAVTAGTEVSSSATAPYTLYFRGTGNTVISDGAAWLFYTDDSESVAASGNIMTLLDYKNPDTAVMGDSCFAYMFSGWSYLTSAPSLPATTLAESCYAGMFEFCSSLTTAPELPATVLAPSCYASMFYNCSLMAAPELPATVLAPSCYTSMFCCCPLMAAPELPATALAESCYEGMFSSCEELTAAPELPATALAESCYAYMFLDCIELATAPELPATVLAPSCYKKMFYGCLKLMAAPELPATALAESCYAYMFCDCSELATAPELPATVLAESCYAYMFLNCYALATAPELPATTLADSCYRSMFENCSNLTTVPLLPAASFNYLSCCESMFSGCEKLKITTEAPTTAGTYAVWYFEDAYSPASLVAKGVSLKNMLSQTASGSIVKPVNGTVYYIMINDGEGMEDSNYTYATTDKVILSDDTGKSSVYYSGARIIVSTEAADNYTVTGITATTAQTDETDITAEKQLNNLNYGEMIAVRVSAKIKHYDVWSYVASGSDLIAVCGGPGECDYAESKSVTVSADTVVWDGNPHGATLSAETLATATDLTITYKQGSTVLPSAPTDIGTYTASVTVNGATASVTFSITKLPITPSVSLTGWVCGNAANTPVVTGNTGNGAVTYLYKVKGAADSAYSATTPTDIGTYTVKATVAESSDCKSGTATADFSIVKAVASVTSGDTTVYYSDISSAAIAWGNNTTLTLLDNVKTNLTISAGQSRTLDLNGYVLKGTGSGSVITNNGGTLNITDTGTSKPKHYFTEGTNMLWNWNSDAEATAFYVEGGVITGGSESGNGGGGIRTTASGTTNVSHINVVGNQTQNWGGGLRGNSTSTYNISDTNILHNYAKSDGGAVNFDGCYVTVTDSAIEANYTGRWGGGFAIFNTMSLNISGCTFDNNVANTDGGAMLCQDAKSSVTVTNSNFDSNTAKGYAGALRLNGSFTATIDGCTFTNNSGTQGGAIKADNTTVVIKNSTFTGNFGTSGGAMQIWNGSLSLTDTTITGNTSSETNGGGIFANCNVTVVGDTVITGNKKGNDTNNLYLNTNKTVTVSNPGENMKVCVTTATAPTAVAPVAITVATNTDCSAHFTSDNNEYVILKNGNGASQVLYISLPPVCEVVTSTDVAIGGNQYSSVQSAIDAAGTNATTIRLIDNTTENIAIAENQSITLDLNGYVLSGDGTTSVIVNDGVATVTDMNPTAVHYFEYVKDGAWVATSTDTGAITMDEITSSTESGAIIKIFGGCITGGKAATGGGIFNKYNATLNICGGNIVGNAAIYGGGVGGAKNTDIIIRDNAVICGNVAMKTGGGVSAVILRISDGTISHNRSYALAAGVVAESSITIGGTTNITGNTLADGTKSNLNVPSPIVEIDTPAGGMQVGVTILGKDPKGLTGAFTVAADTDYSAHFTSDNDEYMVLKNGNGASQVLYVSLPPVCEITASTDPNLINGQYSSVQAAIDAAVANATTIRLIRDREENITIAAGQSITFDLNGYVLSGDGTTSVIKSNGVATITDMNPTAVHYFEYVKDGAWVATSTDTDAITVDEITSSTESGAIIKVLGGCITGGNSQDWGGGILNGSYTLNICGGNIVGNTGYYGGGVSGEDSSGTIVLSGGAIIGNKATLFGGGVYGNTYSTITIAGGTIGYNSAETSGGGVYGNTYSTITVTGGIISDNSAETSGGGVYCVDGTVKMSGGTIANNTAVNFAGGVFALPSFIIGGTANITGNTLADGTDSNLNVFLPFEIGSGAATPVSGANGMRAGVTLLDGNMQPTTGAISVATDTDYSAHFTSDNDEYMILKNGNGASQVLYISLPPVCEIVTSTDINIIGNRYSSVQAALDEAGINATTIRLTDNATENITIGKKNNITLDLNGYVITAEENGNPVIKNNGTFTLTDTNPTTSHYFVYATDTNWVATGTDWMASHTDITVLTVDEITSSTEPGAIIKVLGGCLTGCKTGVCIVNRNGSFTMEGGAVVGNLNSDYKGEGAGIANEATFLMTGGSIIGNAVTVSESGCGGGVINGGAFTMTGGTIAYNTAPMGGGVIGLDGTVTIGGTSLIIGNNGKAGADNLYLMDGIVVTVTDPAWVAPIGVTTQTAPTSGNSIPVTVATDTDYSAYFTSDNDDYSIRDYMVAGKHVLKLTNHKHNWQYAVSPASGATLTATCTDIDCFLSATPSDLTITAPTLTAYGESGKSEKATLSAGVLGGTTVTQNDIRYKKWNVSTWTDLSAAPTEVGTYRAEITVGTATAYVEYTIDKGTPSSAPEASAKNETVKGKADGKLTNVTTEMEYRKASDGAYTAVTAATLTDLPAGEYKVRYKETDTYYASDDQTLTVGYDKTITVIYDSMGGSDVATATDIAYNGTVAKPADPTRADSQFRGWYLNGSLFDFRAELTDDITLEAYWILSETETGKETTLETDETNSTTTKVQVLGDTGVKASGLESIAKEIKQEGNENNNVKVVLTAEKTDEKKAPAAQVSAIKVTAGDKTVDLLSIDMTKFINGTDSGKITDTDGKVVEVLIPFDGTGKENIVIYRYHEGEGVTTFTEARTGADGTFYYENGIIHLFTTKFSTYAVGYTKTGTVVTPVVVNREERPVSLFNAETMLLTNLKPGMRYRVGYTGEWMTAAGTEADMTGKVTEKCTIQIYQPSKGVLEDSPIQEIYVTKADVPAGISAVGCTTSSDNDGKIIGLTSSMEYRKTSTESWISGTGDALASGTYEIRVKASGRTLASDAVTVTVEAYKETEPQKTDISSAKVTLGETPVYNGTEQTVTVQSVTVNGKNATFTVSGNKATHAGSYTLVVTGTGDYTGAVSVTYEIARRPVTVTVENKDSVKGEALEALSYTADGLIKGDEARLVLTTDADAAKPGVYAIKGTCTSSDYDATFVNGTYTVYNEALSENGVTVEAASGLSDSIRLIVNRLVKEEIPEAVKKAEVGKRRREIAVYDIYLTDGAVRIQPDGTLRVTVEIPEELQKKKAPSILHIDEVGSVTDLKATYDAEKHTLTFTTEELGPYYALTAKRPCLWWLLLILLLVLLLLTYLYSKKKKKK